MKIEYNTDTSAQHPNQDEDIVRHSFEKRRVWDKEPIHNRCGGSEFSIMGSMGCSIEEARAFKEAYDKGFPGITVFKQKGSKFVRQNGYVLICQATGHKMYWWDWEKWKEEQESFTEQFWEEYRQFHKGTNDDIAQMVSRHFKVASKWDRMALNGPTQGEPLP